MVLEDLTSNCVSVRSNREESCGKLQVYVESSMQYCAPNLTTEENYVLSLFLDILKKSKRFVTL